MYIQHYFSRSKPLAALAVMTLLTTRAAIEDFIRTFLDQLEWPANIQLMGIDHPDGQVDTIMYLVREGKDLSLWLNFSLKGSTQSCGQGRNDTLLTA
jgi:hypothetical protein